MAFVNKFASDEDIRKFSLDDLWKTYRPSRDELFKSGHGMITVDEDRNILFMTLRQGREEHGNRKQVLLWIDGQIVVADIELIPGLNPAGLKSKPFRISWQLAQLHPKKGLSITRKEIIRILKDALTTYGHRGAAKQIPNTLVDFDF